MIDKNLFLPSESEPEGISFATIHAIFDDGISLIFDGEDTPTQKHYKCNAFMVFKVGDRVKLERDSGTYIVAWSIGNPKTSFAADTATTAATAQSANTAQTAESANTATTANTANTATTANSATTATTATNAANVTTRINGNLISTIFETNGTTVKKATTATTADTATSVNTATNASNVTSSINGKSISTIFESNGTTAKQSTSATSATSATKAIRVEDYNSSSRYIEFRVSSYGVLEFRSSYYNPSTWYKLGKV